MIFFLYMPLKEYATYAMQVLKKAKKCFLESDFNINNIDSYKKLIEENVLKVCALKNSFYYHILDNYGFDLTHDLWEGIVVYEWSLVLTSLITGDLFTLNSLNSQLKSFNYGTTDIRNTPNVLYIPEKEKE
jgi:hypothetical protein